MIGELLSGMAHSSGPGFVGVSLIFIYHGMDHHHRRHPRA